MHHSLPHGIRVDGQGLGRLCPGLHAGLSRRWHIAQEDCAHCRGRGGQGQHAEPVEVRTAETGVQSMKSKVQSVAGAGREDQCWAKALPAAIAGACRDLLGAPSPCTFLVGTWGSSASRLEPGALFTWACMSCSGRAPGPAKVELLTVHRDGSREELGTLNSDPETAQARACTPTEPTSTEPQ